MMNKWLRAVIIAGMTMLSGCLFTAPAYANTMQSLDIHVQLQTDGSGIVTETREMNLTEDTEIYITMENLGGSEISGFQVSDFGIPLVFQPDWQIDASRSEKSGKYGIVTTENGSELCWGIGEYGDHTYTVTYTISGMVRQLKDGQAMNWRFFNGAGNINPAVLSLSIDGPNPLIPENTKIWGFGFEGEVHFDNGRVLGSSSAPLSDSNFVTILIQFTDAPFQPVINLDKTLAEQESIAKEGSSYGQEASPPAESASSVGNSVIGSLVGMAVAVSFAFLAMGMFLLNGAIKKANPLMKAKARRNLNKDKYYRDIPYPEGSMTDVAFMLEKVERGKIEDYFNAFLLKWLKEDHIDHITEEKGFIFKRDESILQLKRMQIDGGDIESRLWNMMQLAAGEDNKLAEKEFSQWAKKNYKEIDDLKNDLSNDSKASMIDRGYLEQKDVAVWKIFTSAVVSSTDRGEELFNRLVQFENYLKDFSLLNEREAEEVALWDNLLIWASLYGLAEEVAKQFAQLYPQYLQESQFTYADFYVMNHFANSFASGYQSGQSAASSGGGGSTSFGGGGGSSGGGGGGSR